MQTPLAHTQNVARQKKSGVFHWWSQRLSAMLLVPLMVWFIFSALGLVGVDHSVFVIWLSAPFNTLLMALMVITLFYHSHQGMKVIVEDYIQNVAAKLISLIMLKIFAFSGIIFSLIAIFLVVFRSQ